MNKRIADIMAIIHKLEGDLEVELAQRRLDFDYTIDNEKVKFQEYVLKRHRQMRSHWLSYILKARPSVALTAPIIYAMVTPFAMLDIFVTLYQLICFRAYGISIVRRRDYIVLDRSQLAYLNWLEKFNCLFCSYANGVIGYVREISARTEQYWCPIKHARRIVGAHALYSSFADYGDVEAYKKIEQTNLRTGAKPQTPE